MNEVACPFDEKAPADAITYTVPEHLRTDIASLIGRRKKLNLFDRDAAAAHNIQWNREFPSTHLAIEKIEKGLRTIAEAPRRTHVEYYANWQFRCPDPSTLRAEFIARGGTLTEVEEKVDKPVPGRTWEKDEVGHLCFEVLGKCVLSACSPSRNVCDTSGRS